MNAWLLFSVITLGSIAGGRMAHIPVPMAGLIVFGVLNASCVALAFANVRAFIKIMNGPSIRMF